MSNPGNTASTGSTARLALDASGFPRGFAWGAATAAYQIEGAVREDGRGESIWDRFAHTPGKIEDGSTGDVATDSYHRWQFDLDLLAELHLNAYRFSVAWPRVLPEGRGKPNARGLDYYDRLVDGLLERGIAPFVTLYHWDLPQALQDVGGWEHRDTAAAFADYAAVVAERLGDRVGHWITLNEPSVVVTEGHIRGTMAPGKTDLSLFAPVVHHLLLGHGRAVQALRQVTPVSTQIGITLNFTALEAATDRAEDVEATTLLDGLLHRIYLDPVTRGAYPEDVLAFAPLPDGLVQNDDLAVIAQPLDFLGANYYTRMRVRAGMPVPEPLPSTGALTTMGWEVYPDGLRDLLLRLTHEYGLATLYITENGAAYPDSIAEDGRVHDPQRSEYLQLHLAAVREALAQGAPVQGYFVWSLLDNFEWARGYTQRFGVAYVDYATQRRILKDSARTYAELAETNGRSLG